jgi:hypothetical protein
VSGQLHVPGALPRSKSSRYILGGPQSRSGRGGEVKESYHFPYRELNSGRPVRSLVTVLTKVLRLPWVGTLTR